MSVEIVSSGLVPLRTKRFQIMTTMKPVPQDKMFGSSAEKIDSSQQGLEFLFSPLLEEYYNPTHGLAMADSAMDRSNADDIHQFRQTNVWELVDKLLARWLFKLKWLWKRTNCCALWKQFGLFVAHADYKSFHIYHDGRKTHFLMVHEGRGLLVSGSSGPGPQLMTPRTINSGLVQNIPSPTPAVPPTKIGWDSLFQPMFDEYFKPPPNVDHPVPEVPTPVPAALTSSPSSTTVDQDAPSTSTSQITSEQQSLVIPQGVEDDFYNIEVAYMDNDPYFGFADSEVSKPAREKE
ncbi:hypothetical protein Tco_0503678 [Tanacetum coccineum]